MPEISLSQLQANCSALREQLATPWRLANVAYIRQVGLIAGVELVKDWRTDNSSTCASGLASVYVRPCPGTACSPGPSATSWS